MICSPSANGCADTLVFGALVGRSAANALLPAERRSWSDIEQDAIARVQNKGRGDRANVRHCTLTPTIVGKACTFKGYVTCIAVGLGAGLADSGHIETLRRADVVVVPLGDDTHSVTTYVLYKQQHFGLLEALQSTLTHIKFCMASRRIARMRCAIGF